MEILNKQLHVYFGNECFFLFLDFAKMSKKCKERTLEGYTLFTQMVEKCRTIYVKGIDKSITYYLVENFFCNKRKSGGGDVEKMDYHPKDGYCIVYFENPSGNDVIKLFS